MTEKNPIADEVEERWSGPIGFRSEAEYAETLRKEAEQERLRDETTRGKIAAIQTASRFPLRSYELKEMASRIGFHLSELREAPGMAVVRMHLESARNALLDKARETAPTTFNGTAIRIGK